MQNFYFLISQEEEYIQKSSRERYHDVNYGKTYRNKSEVNHTQTHTHCDTNIYRTPPKEGKKEPDLLETMNVLIEETQKD